MAEGDGAIYNNFKEQLLLKIIDCDTDTFKMILVTGYVPDIDADVDYADVSGDEYGAGVGYTVGGETLAGLAVAQDNPNDRATWDASNVTWTSLGPLAPNTPSHCIVYDDTASDYLVFYWELGTTATNGGDYTMEFNVVGMMTLT